MKSIIILVLIFMITASMSAYNIPQSSVTETKEYNHNNENIPELNNKRLTIREAEDMVHKYIFNANPKMNPNAVFKLRETTTEEIYTKMQVQVFKLTDESHMSGQDYIIKDGIVNALGSYWGGGGITDMKVMEGSDGSYELVYYYCTGSGIAHYMEGVYKGPNNIKEKVIKIVP